MSAQSVKRIVAVVMISMLLVPTSMLALAADEPASSTWTELSPGEENWYTLDYAGNGEQIKVGMDVKPAGSANFRIVTLDAIRAWESGDELEITGGGTENKHEEADLSWTGSFWQAGTYYLIVGYTGNGQEDASYSLSVSGAEISAVASDDQEEAEVEEAEEVAEVEEAEDVSDAEEAAAPTAEEAKPASSSLATASAVTKLSNQPGRAIVSARGNHFVVDSVPPLGGPNEEINPLDLMLGALATCGTFVYEAAAQEMDIPLTEVATTVEGDFNAAGVKDGSVNPRIQALRVHFDMAGPSEAQAAKLAEEFQARCPIYTTLSRSAPIEISTGEKKEASVAEGLSTATAISTLSNQPGRAIVTARGNHFVVDSVPPLDGPNEERNPLDLALGALGTCGAFIYETAAEEMGIPLTAIAATVEGDFNAAGVKDGSVNPRIQALRVKMEISGATDEQAEKLAVEFQNRCPIFTTLSRSAPIEIQNVTE